MLRFILRAFLSTLLATHAAVAASDFATEMMEATFKVDNDGSYATCFLVRREAPDTALYLATVAHAFDDTTNNTVTLVLRKPKPDGTYERVDHTLALRRNGKPLWVRHENYDVAVMRLSEPLPVQVPALPASALADEARLKAAGARLCSPLFILAYPQGLEADRSGLPVARHATFASPPSFPSATHPTFLADYTAFKGDSGAPAFVSTADGTHALIAGMVVEQHYFDSDLRGLNQSHYIRTPLGVVKILHAQHIRDTLELAAARR